ncbi:allatostatin-A receptor-like isoform X2 [Anneissia japonica]|nr:allatostatin-A receptor-like isoform X2 [Anneissia japonica]
MIYNKIFRKSITNTLLLHQSILDFLGCCLFLAFYNNDAPSGDGAKIFCKARVMFWYISAASTYNLVMLTIERYLAVAHPLMYRKRQIYRKRLIPLSIPHLCGFLSSLQLGIFADEDKEYPGECMYDYHGDSARVFSGILLFTTYWLIPVCIMGYCYICILLGLRRRKNVGLRRDSSNTDSKPTRLNKQERNLLYTLVVVCIAFLITVTPNFVLYLIYAICNCFAFSKVSIHEVTVLMNTSNLCINPFIYCFNFKEFQREVVKIKNNVFQKNHIFTTKE